jgi:hypothetical protein
VRRRLSRSLIVLCSSVVVADGARSACNETCSKDLCCLEEVCLAGSAFGACVPTSKAQQGIAVAGSGSSTRFFTSRGTCETVVADDLFRWKIKNASAWEQDDSHNISASLCSPGDAHVGDVATHGGNLYAPVSNFTQAAGNATTIEISRFATDTLDAGSSWNMTSDIAVGEPAEPPGDLAGLAFHAGKLYGIEFVSSGTPRIFRWALQGTSKPTLETEFDIETTKANGMVVHPPYVYVTNGAVGDPERAKIDIYDFEDLDSMNLNESLATYTYEITNHAEGVTIREKDGEDQLWVCAGAGEKTRRIQHPGLFVDCRRSAEDPPPCPAGSVEFRFDREFTNCLSENARQLVFRMATDTLVYGAKIRKGVPFRTSHSECVVAASEIEVDVDLEDGTVGGTVKPNQKVRVEGVLCEQQKNEIVWENEEFVGSTSTCQPAASGFSVDPPVDLGGSFRHDIYIENHHTGSLQLRNLEAKFIGTAVGNLSSLDFSGATVLVGATPVTIGMGLSSPYSITTPIPGAGGHVYARYEISNVSIPTGPEHWDLVITDHPVTPVVPAAGRGEMLVLLLLLAASGIAGLAVLRSKA